MEEVIGVIKEGVVAAIEGERITVKFVPEASCGSCTACSGRACQAETTSEVAVRVGDKVAVDMPGNGALRYSALTYGVPLSSLLLGLLAGFLFSERVAPHMEADLFIAIVAGIFLVAGFLVLHALSNIERFVPKTVARITEVLENDVPS
ncbi:MAG: SoxR reducing system RseC family protein [Oscillospiraceae bacterium]|jgi:positive regulator of sigma E activity|nr:SoxR reducing system RseC family protein [Oscillospiraceae bacterium]